MRGSSFKEGQEVSSIYFTDGGYIQTGMEGVDKISVVLENGQNSKIPWFAVWINNKIEAKHNGAHLESVVL